MATSHKPVPKPTPETQPFWDGAAVGELRVQRCEACLRHYFYPRPHCPHCGSAEVAWVTASGGVLLGAGGDPTDRLTVAVLTTVIGEAGREVATSESEEEAQEVIEAAITLIRRLNPRLPHDG